MTSQTRQQNTTTHVMVGQAGLDPLGTKEGRERTGLARLNTHGKCWFGRYGSDNSLVVVQVFMVPVLGGKLYTRDE